ncbi:N-acetyltransferase [Sphingomonas sp. BT-65]|uniref:GNAT family N-acetyltransferase n=1 Tax=Sphingomonas sp. BT-65 TaxID=2989821 RepID=UPI002236B8A2|nr:GNAT family N-acetyltransferase [Sphingomonas sp. BT-65]MCW4460843.1 N-acetyltransferase [Sphingomonas sp. BT-65]
MSKVRDNPAEHRFELAIEGSDEPAVAYYQVDGDRLTLTHTEVPQAFAGRGIGSELARGVFDAIRASGRKAVLRCRFMGGFYARHPEYADIVDG